MEAIQALGIILDLGLQNHSIDIRLKFPRQFRVIFGFDQPFACQIANEGLEIFHEAIAGLLDFFADVFILRAQLAAESAEGATQDFAERAVLFLLIMDDALAIVGKTFQRRHLTGKGLVEQGRVGFPMALISGHGQIGLGLESVIEAALVHASLGADVIHADGTVAAFPDQLQRCLEELSFGFAFLFHKVNVVDRLV